MARVPIVFEIPRRSCQIWDMTIRPYVVNFGTRFTVYCPECGSVEHRDSLLDAETLRRSHVCPPSPSEALGAELREVCRC